MKKRGGIIRKHIEKEKKKYPCETIETKYHID